MKQVKRLSLEELKNAMNEKLSRDPKVLPRNKFQLEIMENMVCLTILTEKKRKIVGYLNNISEIENIES